jgi:hypothetical protein
MKNPDLALLDYTVRACNTILDEIYKRNPRAVEHLPESDCCRAPMERVADERYLCSSCGRLCCEATLSMP